MAAAADLLDERDYHAIRMLDISQRADLSNGAIYQYFDNKRHLVLELLQEFVAHAEQLLLGLSVDGPPFERLFQAYVFFVRFYGQNRGLMATLHRLSDELSDVGELAEASYSKWSRKLVQLLAKSALQEANFEELAVTARALAVMGNEFLYDLFVRQSPMLAHLEDSPTAVADALALIWYRALFAANPPNRHSTAVQGRRRPASRAQSALSRKRRQRLTSKA